MRRDLYFGHLKLDGEENAFTLTAANNYASSLMFLKRSGEAKSVLRKIVPVARRVLGEGNNTTLMMTLNYAQSLCRVDGATLDDLREAVEILEDAGRIARRVLGGAHPTTRGVESAMEGYRKALQSSEGKA